MGRFSRDEFLTKYHLIVRMLSSLITFTSIPIKEDISVESVHVSISTSQDAFIVTAFGKFRNREEIRMVLGAFRAWDEEHKMLLAPRLYPLYRDATTAMAGISSNDGFQKSDTICSCRCSTVCINYRREPTTS